jgi:hypothetical protein
MSAGGGVAVALTGTDDAALRGSPGGERADAPTSEEERTVILLLAYVHLYHGAAHKAETLYAALHALAPHDAGVAKGLAGAQLALGKAAAALGVLDGITGPGEPGAVVQLLRARALVHTGQMEDAQVAMRAFCTSRTAKP